MASVPVEELLNWQSSHAIRVASTRHIARYSKRFLSKGKDISDLGVLAEIAQLVGLDPEEAKTAIELGTHRKRVIDQEHRTTALGIRAVPTILLSSAGMPIDSTVMISGAPPYEMVQPAVKQAIGKAREELRHL